MAVFIAVVIVLGLLGGGLALTIFLFVRVRKASLGSVAPNAFYQRLHALLQQLGPIETTREKYGKGQIDVHRVRFERHGHRFVAMLRGPFLSVSAHVQEAGEAPGRSAYRSSGKDKPLERLPLLILRRETSLDRLAKGVGLAKEAQTGNRTFDDAIYVESDSVSKEVQQIVSSSALQENTLALLKRGATAVHTNHEGPPIGCTWSGSAAFALEAGGIEHATSLIAQIVDELPPFANTTPPKRVRGQLMTTASWILALATFLAAVLATAVFPTIYQRGEKAGLGFGLLLTIAAVLFALARMRGRPRALRYFVATSFAWLINGPSISVAAIHTLNATLDGQTIDRDATVLSGKKSRRSKGGDDHYLTVEPWAPHDKPITIKVSAGIFAAGYVPGSTLQLDTGPGALGYEWIRGIRSATPPLNDALYLQ